jgi:hypothetical protein
MRVKFSRDLPAGGTEHGAHRQASLRGGGADRRVRSWGLTRTWGRAGGCPRAEGSRAGSVRASVISTGSPRDTGTDGPDQIDSSHGKIFPQRQHFWRSRGPNLASYGTCDTTPSALAPCGERCSAFVGPPYFSMRSMGTSRASRENPLPLNSPTPACPSWSPIQPPQTTVRACHR